MPEIKTTLSIVDELTPGMKKAADGVRKESDKITRSTKSVSDGFGQLAKQVLSIEMVRRAAMGLAGTLKMAEGYAEMAKTAKTASDNLASSIGRSLMPTVSGLTKSINELSSESAVVGQAIGGAFAGIVATIKIAAVGIYKGLEYITFGVMGLVATVGLIPDILLPPGWGKGIDDAAASLNDLRRTFKIAGEDMAADAAKSWGDVGKIFSGELKAGKAKLPGAKAAATTEGPGAGKMLDTSTEKYAEAQQASLERLVQMRLDMMADGQEKELAQIAWKQQQELAMLDENHAVWLTSEEQFQAEKQAIIDKYEQQRVASGIAAGKSEMEEQQKKADEAKKIAEQDAQLYQRTQDSKFQAASGFFGGVSALLAVAGKKSKEAAQAAKALAIVQAVIDTAASAIKSFKAMADIPTVGPALGAIAAAGAIALGAAQIATISSAKFAQGGIVGGSSYAGDRVPAQLNSGEMVLNREQQSNLLAMANGRGGASVSVGGDTIIINGNADQAAIKAIQKTREDQLRDLHGMLKELSWHGMAVA